MFVQKYKRALDVLLKKPVMLWGLSLLSVLLNVIASIVTFPTFLLTFFATTLLQCGMIKVYLDGLQGKKVNSSQLFSAFNKNCLRIVGGMAWKSLWIVIWALIPIVGPIIAIVKAYSYAFVPYILVTKPEVTATDALKLSMEMTNGKKGQMFLADICFTVGLWLVSFVLGFLSAIPFIGALFTLVLVVLSIAVLAFSPIFTGLYKAAFYEDDSVMTDTAE